MAKQKHILITVLLVIIVNASAYRTIITTVEIDEPKPRTRTQSCRQEVEEKDLSSCVDYIGQSRKSPVLALQGVENQQEQVPRQCCSQVKQLRDDCQCEGITSVLKQQLEREEVGREEYKQAVQRANNIASSCGLSQRCQIQEPWY
ncbi:hypothetical protein P3X46_006690 [Hevea brasiliensis]|uniref:Bifunctional inhibitor/plant lipid transfer protein/seed storage helical domain-containing protein n=1 Tax=Hevea brasiliensis TaxID=3981 RepID=A0ABQ9MST3_HEVBR|nr:2S seed storage albumin protein [Hevea brasiliensis]KAJ9182730.1 hypothetical protein P3X46_006690 [Hevea brasiliensis]